jgi:aspartyl protease family protein
MPTGFMPHFIALLLLLLGNATWAADVALIGVLGDKAAVFALDGGEPKAVKIGHKWNGITLISVERDQATVEIDGKRRLLKIGQHYRSATTPSSDDRQSVTLSADSRGHFFTQGAVNGNPVRFLVDTGATSVALPASEAQRLGIDYRKGERGFTNTAGGLVPVYRVRFDNVKLGSIELAGVDGIVIEQGLDVALLGMTFLNRVEMKRDGQTMMLIRRF